MSIEDDLAGYIRRLNVRMPDHWDGNTSLIRSGIIDSVALLQLITWIEVQTGKPLDPTQIDLAGELDSADDIVCFIERNRTC